MARLLSFRFDDGFMTGARKAARILGPHRGSYFIVGDRVLGTADLTQNERLRGRDFGSVEAWRAMAVAGHDIQPHSYSHRFFSQLTPAEANAELRMSVDVVRRICPGPYVFAFPFNDLRADLNWLAAGISAAGFATASSADPIQFNTLSSMNRFAINSWAVRERDIESVFAQLRTVPDESWTVLAFHSLDGEGFEPWSSEGFARLVAVTIDQGFSIVTVQSAIQLAAARNDWDLQSSETV